MKLIVIVALAISSVEAVADYAIASASPASVAAPTACTSVGLGSAHCALVLNAGGATTNDEGLYCLPQSFFNDATGAAGAAV